MKTCIIWRGVSGSGKSTLDDLIRCWFGSHFPAIGRSNSASCTTDDYWWMATCSRCGHELGRMKLKDYSLTEHVRECEVEQGVSTSKTTIRPVYRFDVHQLQDAHDWNYARFQKACDEGVGLVTVPNVNYAHKHYRPYQKYAESRGYQVFVLHVECDVHDAAARQLHSLEVSRVHKQAARFEPVHTPWVCVSLPGPGYRPVCVPCHRVADWHADEDYFYCQKCNQRLGDNVRERSTRTGDF